MPAIDRDQGLVILITVHVCAPEDQEDLVALLLGGAAAICQGAPGFISASIHRSLDGTRVANEAQYRSRADVEAAWRNPAIGGFASRVKKLASSVDAHLYEVADTVLP